MLGCKKENKRNEKKKNSLSLSLSLSPSLPPFLSLFLPLFFSNRRHLPVLDPRRVHAARALLEVGLVLRVSSFEPDHFGVALEGQNVGREAVEEPDFFFRFFVSFSLFRFLLPPLLQISLPVSIYLKTTLTTCRARSPSWTLQTAGSPPRAPGRRRRRPRWSARRPAKGFRRRPASARG